MALARLYRRHCCLGIFIRHHQRLTSASDNLCRDPGSPENVPPERQRGTNPDWGLYNSVFGLGIRGGSVDLQHVPPKAAGCQAGTHAENKRGDGNCDEKF